MKTSERPPDKRVFILTARRSRSAEETHGDVVRDMKATGTLSQADTPAEYRDGGHPYWTTDIGDFRAYARGSDNLNTANCMSAGSSTGRSADIPLSRTHTPREIWRFASRERGRTNALEKRDNLRYR